MNAPVSFANLNFPRKFQCLFQPKRYKVFYGGRAGAKTWNIARALLVIALQRKVLILCTRELQTSISDSVHRVLKDQIELMGVSQYFDITENSIICTSTGSEFAFHGIRLNVNKIRSFEGADICWVEEAATVSANSWKVLIPTIRKSGSEIWISFNPELDTDETYKRFVLDPPSNAEVVLVNYKDNPWLPDTIREEIEELKRKNYKEYLNVYEGHCKEILEGAIFGEELRVAREEGRITGVPYYPSIPVDVFWDLGWADMMALWFVQKVGLQFNVIRYHQDRKKTLDKIVQKIQSFEYTIGTQWLPHDAKAATFQTGKTTEELVRAKGYKVRVVPRISISERINAARELLPLCNFDKVNCEVGINCLKHYAYDVDAKTKKYSDDPKHDEYSHGSDAFCYLAVGYTGPAVAGNEEKIVRDLQQRANPYGVAPTGWTGL